MPLQNRVSPWGEIVASTARGTLMGNRGGQLHDEERKIIRQYATRRWITCVLEFKGRRRVVMSPGRYTELFFLDEAVSLAAGHRPCAECRRKRFNAFKEAWSGCAYRSREDFLYADAIDKELHQARIDRRRGRAIYRAPLKSLPDGCFVEINTSGYLLWKDALLRWSPGGYIEKHCRPDNLTAAILTPEPTVRCLRQGYRPEIHSSAFAIGAWSVRLPGR